jgi:hypothetical protein
LFTVDIDNRNEQQIVNKKLEKIKFLFRKKCVLFRLDEKLEKGRIVKIKAESLKTGMVTQFCSKDECEGEK